MNRLNHSEETILKVAGVTSGNARAHLAVLSTFGVTETLLNQFDADIQTARAMPVDETQRIELSGLTSSKDDILDKCYDWCGDARLRLEMAFGFGCVQLKQAPSQELNPARNSESAMIPFMKKMIKLTTDNHVELSAQGQTEAIRDQGPQLLEQLTQADNLQETGKDTKKAVTQSRYVLFKKIYDQVNKLNKVGRRVFRDDPVNLVLFQSKWPAPSPAAKPVEPPVTQ